MNKVVDVLKDEIIGSFTSKSVQDFEALILEDLEVLMETFPEGR